jgi:putative membrane protein
VRNPVEAQIDSRSTRRALWALLFLFAAANVLPVFPQAFPRSVLVASQIIPAALFALIHGAKVYRLRGILGFTLISMVVGYSMETLGVLSGFPFGRYYFTDGMGPKLFVVPILMGPAYVGMGYVSWTVARAGWSSSSGKAEMAGPRLMMIPMAASFLMVAWDLSFDPALSTIGRYWIWIRGGSYFGVPISNFLGWYLTNYLIYQLFALYIQKRSKPESFHAAHVRLGVIFYSICAAGGVLRAISPSALSVVTDSTGTPWRIGYINAACALASLFIMGAFALLAFARLSAGTPGLGFTSWDRLDDRPVPAQLPASPQAESEPVS